MTSATLMDKSIVIRAQQGGLDNDELKIAIQFYTDMEAGLFLLGPEFALARREVSDTLIRLQQWQQARKEETV